MLREKKISAQASMWIATDAIEAMPSIPFYRRLKMALDAAGFGDQVRELCRPYYADGVGAPGIDPEVFFKMMLVGFMEGITSNRGIAARCADSLSVREFLNYTLTEATPDQSSLSVIRDRLPEEVFRDSFGLTQKALYDAKLLKGKHLGVDSTTVEANAAMRALRHRVTGDTYWRYVQKLAAKDGINPKNKDAVRRFDAKRKNKKMSNDEWEHMHDPDARIGQMKTKSTHMMYLQEHVVDMETGAIVDVNLRLGNAGEAAGLAERVQDAERHMNTAIGAPISKPTVDTVTADKGYHKLEEIRLLHKKRYATVIPEMDRVRIMDALTAEELRALDTNTCTVRSTFGKALLRKRGEMLERSFANVMNAGGMRRTTLRGLEKNRKRSLVGALCANLCLYARHLVGFGTVRQFRAAAKPAWA